MCSISFLSSENDLEGLQEGHWNILRFLGSGEEGWRSSSLASPTSAMTASFVIMVASGLAVVVRALKTTSTSDGNDCEGIIVMRKRHSQQISMTFHSRARNGFIIEKKLFPFQQGLVTSSCETYQQSLQYGGCSQQYRLQTEGSRWNSYGKVSKISNFERKGNIWKRLQNRRQTT